MTVEVCANRVIERLPTNSPARVRKRIIEAITKEDKFVCCIPTHCVTLCKTSPSLRVLVCYLTTFFEVSLGYRSSPKVQRTSDYQSKVGFPYTWDRFPEVVDRRRERSPAPKLYRGLILGAYYR
jgi:hypothetical protein